MAALCPGVQYGLSSQESFGENKDLIFVKLTDSAFRAIEEYLRNQSKLSQNPTIRFLGNEGQLSFPSVQNGCTMFNFSISSTADMEGPGGSFECIKQSAPPRGSLEALGAIPHKIRIHANEDVYEATRHRMTVAEENHKNKCTREIKPNQNDIGRKVKLKQMPGRTMSSTVSSSRRDVPPFRESLIKSPNQQNLNNRTPPLYANSNGLTNGLGSNLVNSSRPSQNKPSMPEIMRRPIKERLIHLLALKPFKKPELHERLVREGLREKGSITSILKQISYMKDNSYHLNRAMWNDVREDWPFYTETERQILKRRKPQNLTPPGSSDGGSSGSGQSPTSTHPGSPPLPISTTPSSKRPGYYDGADGLPTKRQRISHYRKPSYSDQTSICWSPPVENNNSQRRPVTDSRDASNMNPRSRESPSSTNIPANLHHPLSSITNGHHYNGYGLHLSDDDDDDEEDDEDMTSDVTLVNNNISIKQERSCDSHNNNNNNNNNFSINFSVKREKSTSPFANVNNVVVKSKQSPRKNGFVTSIETNNNNNKVPRVNEISPVVAAVTTSSQQPQTRHVTTADSDREKGNKMINSSNNMVSGNVFNKRGQQQSMTQSPPILLVNGSLEKHADQKRVLSATDPGQPPPPPPPSSKSVVGGGSATIKKEPVDVIETPTEFPDYMTEYTTINNVEQRRRYKADFNADYSEYKKLHAVVEKVSRRFAELEERLNQTDEKSPKYKEIKRLIVKEYRENKQDLEHQRDKRRFQYLHEKLSHIKRLVLEYDQTNAQKRY